MLPCGAGCCLWTRGFSGCQARPWGRAAPWAARPRAVRAATFDWRFGSLSNQAPPPTSAAARPCGPSGALHAGCGGGLHYMSVSSACRSLMSCNSPRLVTVRSRFEVVWCPKCRPPRRKTLKIGCCGRGGLRFGRSGVSRGVSFVREPLNMRVNPLIRT